MGADEFRVEAALALRRMARGDFQRERATQAERASLAAAAEPVRGALAQDYAAWRKSLLWVAGLALTFLAVLEAATFSSSESVIRAQAERAIEGLRSRLGDGWQAEQQVRALREQLEGTIGALGRENLETIDGVFAFLIVPVLVGGVLALVGAWRWRDVRLSRRLARIGFLILFLTPFALALLPVKDMLDFGHLQEAAQREQIAALIGLEVGMKFFLLVGPRAIALFPGLIRSSMALKTLLPESPMPGWAAALVAPLYAIFLMVVFALVVQSYGNAMLILGLGCLMVSPLVYLWRGRDVLRPHRPEEVSRVVGGIRRVAAVVSLAGGVCLAVFMLELDAFGFDDFVKFFVSVMGNVVLLTVVGGDFLLALLRKGHEQSKALVESNLEGALEARFGQLAEGGLTELRTLGSGARPGAPPPA